MKSRVSLLIGSICVVLMNCALNAQPAVREVTEEITYLRPQSFDDLWNEADLVAHIRVLRSNVQGKRGPSATSLPAVFTEYRAIVLESYRGPTTIESGSELRLMQRAGELRTPQAVVRVADAEILRSGTEYVVFLRWNPGYQHYETWVGPDAIYELEHGKVRPLARVPLVSKYRGMNSDNFIAEMRSRQVGRK